MSNIGADASKLFDIFQQSVSMLTEDDPRQDFLESKMCAIRSNIALVKEGEEELQDKFVAMKRALQFFVLPEVGFKFFVCLFPLLTHDPQDRFAAFVDPLRLQPDHVDFSLLNSKLVRLAKYWRNRHEWFEEIQNVLADAATKWLDQRVTTNQQRKVLRTMQKLYRQLQAQVDKQDVLLTAIEVTPFHGLLSFLLTQRRIGIQGVGCQAPCFLDLRWPWDD